MMRNDGAKLGKILSIKMLQMALIGLAASGGLWASHKIGFAVQRQTIMMRRDQDGRQLLNRLELIIDQSHNELTKLSKVGLASRGLSYFMDCTA
jgi:hypothetical protein